MLCLVRFTVSIRRGTFANFMELPVPSPNTELYESFCQAQHFLASQWKTTEKGHKWADKIRRAFCLVTKTD